jgi:hypothetical protein
LFHAWEELPRDSNLELHELKGMRHHRHQEALQRSWGWGALGI